ncbi:MAG TPA: hypothetical protein VK893_08655 [Pyrinomonadaceae bacterium]|nr:hypothetical protein [Pyrinomonadaceae bacterium]
MIALLALLQDVGQDFDNLGKLLLGGTAAAVIVAVGFTLVRFKLRDKKPAASGFISISSPQKNEGE